MVIGSGGVERGGGGWGGSDICSRARDRRTVLMRYEPGAVIPRHRHVGDEQIFVLEGSVSDDTGTCAAGDYARRPPGCVHSVRSAGGALVLAVMSGGAEPGPEGRSCPTSKVTG